MKALTQDKEVKTVKSEYILYTPRVRILILILGLKLFVLFSKLLSSSFIEDPKIPLLIIIINGNGLENDKMLN